MVRVDERRRFAVPVERGFDYIKPFPQPGPFLGKQTTF
jgi:hypothetical protein